MRRAGQYSRTDKRRIRRILQSSVVPVASGAVAALELLPRAAPAGVVAPDLVVLGDDALLGSGGSTRVSCPMTAGAVMKSCGNWCTTRTGPSAHGSSRN